MSNKREWHFYLDDMISFIENVQIYTEGFDQATFEATGLNYDATIRNLELVGEAATHIPDDVRASNSSIPWRLSLLHGID